MKKQKNSAILIIDKSDNLHGSILFSTAFLMSVTRMTSSEAVRAVIGSDLESGTEMVDLVETELSSWESEVGGLVTERLRCGSVTDDAEDTWVERRLDNYYTVSGEFRNIFTKIF